MGGRVRVGIGGWTYAPWRGTFYPDDLPQKNELAYAAAKLTTIEINGTFYGAQKPATFAKWRDETPEDFAFAVKAPRYATHRRKLSEAGPTIERFIQGGLLELKHKLGPINWQLMPSMPFDPDDLEAFLKLLPKHAGRQELKHAVEVRHESFRAAQFVDLARQYGVAVIIAGDSKYPQIADMTADFGYFRIMGTECGETLGYTAMALDRWAARVMKWASGSSPADFRLLAKQGRERRERDVYLYVISGHKEINPAAARELIERLPRVHRASPRSD